MSYRKSYIKSNLQKTRKKKSIFKKLWFWICVLIVLFFLTSGYFVVFYQGVQVEEILVSGNNKISSSEIGDFVSQRIKISFIKFGSSEIYSKSIFLVNSSEINEELSENFSEIGEVEIIKKFFKTLIISVKEKEASAVFCQNQEFCYAVDREGVPFEALNEISSGMVKIYNQGIQSVKFGERVVDPKTIKLVLSLQNMLDGFQIKLMEVWEQGSSKLIAVTSEGWKIYFNPGSYDSMSMELVKLNSLLSEGLDFAERENLKYVDLRPKDRAIVCDNSVCGD